MSGIDNTKKFTGKAEFYTQGRPRYPKEFIDYLYGEAGFTAESIVADIGSGTGIFTREILERGSLVYAVEPNADMRAVAEADLSGFTNYRSVNAAAESTGLPDASVNFITVAQAAHWFDAPRFAVECRRILKPNGKLVLVWNTRVKSSPITQKTKEVLKRYELNASNFSADLDARENEIYYYFAEDCAKVVYPNNQLVDKAKFISRNLSESYAPAPGDSKYDELMAEFDKLFNEYAVDGKLVMPTDTVGYIGSVK